MTPLQAGTTYSDVSQSLLVLSVFLAVLTVVLIGAAYLEPRSKPSPCARGRLTGLRGGTRA